MSKTFALVLGGVGVATLVALLYVRHASVEADRYHKDPNEVSRPKLPNNYLVSNATGAQRPAMSVDRSPADLLQAADDWAMSQPNTSRLAGDVDQGMITYLMRTEIIKYPDILTVRVDALENKSVLSIYAKSIYGRYDWGVSKARVSALLTALGL